MFQSRCGFSPRRDDSGGGGDSPNPEFQSRCGFSPRRDLSQSVQRPPRGLGFNPVVGFLPVATPQCRPGRLTPAQFQSRCGFSPRRDPSWQWTLQQQSVSIPLWVFSPSRPDSPGGATDSASLFQSRCGFSPRRDRVVANHFDERLQVSIPLWVFSPSRHIGSSRAISSTPRFNPVVGFLPVATGKKRGLGIVGICFNPVVGFLPVAT